MGIYLISKLHTGLTPYLSSQDSIPQSQNSLVSGVAAMQICRKPHQSRQSHLYLQKFRTYASTMMTNVNFCKRLFLLTFINDCQPVLNISLPTTNKWTVHSEYNCLETSPFSSSHKLCNQIPVFKNLGSGQQTEEQAD